mmetsp:Transcript_11515/g.16003  ORF Transcript_11515/g.16003 Transcript_11515/m.16003 type:complete len:502 (+) Transcript_11515:134-1639(+)
MPSESEALIGRKYDKNFKGVVEDRKVHDFIFGLLFVGMIVGMIAISGIAFEKGDPSKLKPSDEYDDTDGGDYWFQDAVANLKKDVWVLVGGLGLAIALGALWIQLMKMFTKFFIYMTVFLGVILVAALGVYCLSYGMSKDDQSFQIGGGILLGLAAILLICTFFLRKKIQLTSLLFRECCQAVQHNPALFIVSLVVVAIFVGFTAWWIAVFIYLYSITDSDSSDSASSSVSSSSGDTMEDFDHSIRNLMWYQVFAYFWVYAFLSAVFQVTVAGAVATWYFSRNVNGPAQTGSPSWKSFRRALTYHFGSLAFGSLILATAQFINWILEQAKKKNSENKLIKCIICCLQCCVRCCINMISFLNKFAYIYIAIEGDSFCHAAKECYHLMERNMFSAVVIDYLSEFVLFVGKALGTAASVILTLAVLHGMDHDVSAATIAIVAVGAYLIFDLFSHIIGVGVDAVFVSYCIDLEQAQNGGALYMSDDLHSMLQDQKKQYKKSEENV